MTDVSRGPVIEARDLHRVYRRDGVEVHALRGATLTVDPGEFVAVLGPSGSGKSTLLNLLGAIDRPSSGTMRLLGHDTGRLSDRELTRLRLHHVGFVFQRFHLLPALTAAENVELPMAEAGVPRAERRHRVAELLGYVGLTPRADHRPGQLSGGEMQRVAIARALANRPSLLLADEPTGELDRNTGDQIAALFRRVNADGTAVIVVTHDSSLAGAASVTYCLEDGHLIAGSGRMGRAVADRDGEGARGS